MNGQPRAAMMHEGPPFGLGLDTTNRKAGPPTCQRCPWAVELDAELRQVRVAAEPFDLALTVASGQYHGLG
jgi:hypothetical protein